MSDKPTKPVRQSLGVIVKGRDFMPAALSRESDRISPPSSPDAPGVLPRKTRVSCEDADSARGLITYTSYDADGCPHPKADAGDDAGRTDDPFNSGV
jgi:hypothetical protein